MRLACLLLLASAAASAQPAVSAGAQADPARTAALRRASWLSVALYGTTSDDVGANVQLHVPLGSGPSVVQIGTSSTIGIFGGNVLTEGHVALGTSLSAGPLFVTATAGASLGNTFSPLGDEDVIVVGAVAGVQARVVVFSFLAIGAEAFAHVNAVRPVSGAGFHLSFGRLPGALIRETPLTPRRPGP